MAIDYAPEIETKAATNTRENTGIENKTTPEDAFVKQIQRQLAEVNKIILRAQEMGTNFKLTPHDLVQINDAIRRLKKAIDSGKFGDIQRLEAEEQRLIKLQDTARTNLIENGHVKEVELIEAVSSGDLNAESIEQQIELSGVNAFVVGMLGGDAVKELGLNPTDHQLEEYLTKIDRTRAIEIASTLESVIDEILLHGALDLREADKLETSVLAKMASKIRNITGTERSKPEKRSIEDRIEILSIMLGPAARSQDIIDKIRRETDLDEKIHKINLYFSILGHNFIDNLKQGGVAWMGLYFKTQREVTDLFGKVGEQARTALLGKLPENLRDFLKSNKAQELTNDIRDQIRNLSPQDALAKIAKIVNDRLGVKDLAGAPDSAYKLSSLFNGESADIQLICTVLQYDILTQIAASEKFKDFRFSAHNLIVGNSGHVVLYTREGNNYYKIDTLNNPSGDSLFEKIDEADVPAEVLSNLADEITHEESISNSFNKLNSDMMVNFATFAKTPEEKVQLLNTALQTDSDNLLALLYLRKLALESGNKTYADIYTNKAKRVFDKQYPNQEDKFNNLVDLAGEDILRYEAWSGRGAIEHVLPQGTDPQVDALLNLIDSHLRNKTDLNDLEADVLNLVREELGKLINKYDTNPSVKNQLIPAAELASAALYNKYLVHGPKENRPLTTFKLFEDEVKFIENASTENVIAFILHDIEVFVNSTDSPYLIGRLHENYLGRLGEAVAVLQGRGRDQVANDIKSIADSVNAMIVASSKLAIADDQEKTGLPKEASTLRMKNLRTLLDLGMVNSLKQKLLAEAKRLAAEGNGYITAEGQNKLEQRVLKREEQRLNFLFEQLDQVDDAFEHSPKGARQKLSSTSPYQDLEDYQKEKRDDMSLIYNNINYAFYYPELGAYKLELDLWESNWDKQHPARNLSDLINPPIDPKSPPNNPQPMYQKDNKGNLILDNRGQPIQIPSLLEQKKQARREYIMRLIKRDFRIGFAEAHITLELDGIFVSGTQGNPNTSHEEKKGNHIEKWSAIKGQGKRKDIYGNSHHDTGTRQEIGSWQGNKLVRYDFMHGHYSNWEVDEHENKHFNLGREDYGTLELFARQGALFQLAETHGFSKAETYKLVYGGLPWNDFNHVLKIQGHENLGDRIHLWNLMHGGSGPKPIAVDQQTLINNHARWRNFVDFYGMDYLIAVRFQGFLSDQYMRGVYLDQHLKEFEMANGINRDTNPNERLGLQFEIYQLGLSFEGTNSEKRGEELRAKRAELWDGQITEINPMVAMHLYATYNTEHYHFKDFWGDDSTNTAKFMDQLVEGLTPKQREQYNVMTRDEFKEKINKIEDSNRNPANFREITQTELAQWRYQVFSSLFTPLIEQWRARYMVNNQIYGINYEQLDFRTLKPEHANELQILFQNIDPNIVQHFQEMVSGMTDMLLNQGAYNRGGNGKTVGESFTEDPYMYMIAHSTLYDTSDIPYDLLPMIQDQIGEGDALGKAINNANLYGKDFTALTTELLNAIKDGKDPSEILIKLFESESARHGQEGASLLMALRFVAYGRMEWNRYMERIGRGNAKGTHTEAREMYMEELATKGMEELYTMMLALKPHMTEGQQKIMQILLDLETDDKIKRMLWQSFLLSVIAYFSNIGITGLEQVGLNK